MKNFIRTTVISLSLMVGQAFAIPAPEFSLPAEDGLEISLSTYKGNIIVLEWTNYECPFVRKHYKSKNIPELQKKYEEKGVIWLSINSGSEGKQGYLLPKDAKPAMEKIGSNATHLLLDDSGYIGRLYGAQTTPHIFIIDKKGNIVYRGAIDNIASPFIDDLERAENYVSRALDEVLNDDPVSMAVTTPYGCSVKY